MESFVAYASFAGSAFSTLATAYFWFVRSRGERPNLKPYVVDREFFLGAMMPDARHIGVKLGLVIANSSTLPNALLKANLQVRGRSGQWLTVGDVTLDKSTPLPLNLSPLTTVLVRLNGTLAFPFAAGLEDGNKTVVNYLREHVAEPRMARVELHSLKDRVDRVELRIL